MKMKNFVMSRVVVALLTVIFLSVTAHASVVIVAFDEPEYVAGQLPPASWSQDYGAAGFANVGAGVGYGGTQGLEVTNAPIGASYDLPTTLTSDMGAVSISVLFKPGGGVSNWNFMDYGGLQIGRGDKSVSDSASYLGVIFRKVSGNNGIYGPNGGVGYGAYMGFFSPNQWYEMKFELNESWDTMTFRAGSVGGTMANMTYAWDGGDITRVWALGQNGGSAPIYDNLTTSASAVPEPATAGLSMGMLTLGAVLLTRRPSRTKD